MTEPLRAAEPRCSSHFFDDCGETSEPNLAKAPVDPGSQAILHGPASELEGTDGPSEDPAAEYGFWLENHAAGSMDRANGSEDPKRGENNAERTRYRTSSEPYAGTGKHPSGDTVYAGAALIKNHDDKTGIDTEMFSASVQVGDQNEFQLGGLRLTKSGSRGEIGVETLTARASGGIHNDDGSTGINLGDTATLLGAEGTLNLGHGNSVTLGVSCSLGSMRSVGIRDQDGDGRKELCVKGSHALLTRGFCIEE